ncbi:MAG: glycosyltransferase family 4 protein [Marinilabiliales bacterium]
MPYPPVDGGAIAIFNMAVGFYELGNDVSILSMNTRKHYYNVEKIPDEIKSKFKFYTVDINTDIIWYKALINLLFSKKPYNAVRFIKNKFKKQIIELLQSEKFDLIQIEGLYILPYTDVIRKYSNAIISYRAHNIEHEIWERTVLQEQSFLKRKYLKILSNRLKKFEVKYLNTYDVLVPITKRDEKKFIELGNIKPVHTTQTGLNLKKFELPHQDIEFPSIFHIGALDWGPNQEGLKWFIENIWKDIYKENPDLSFSIAGRNAPLWLIEYFQKIDGIKYYGEVKDAYLFMASKAVMIVPLLSGSGMRIKIIEGMAMGKAIISTSIGAEGISCIHNKNIIIADTVQQFKDAIKLIVKNRNEIEKIGKNAREFIYKSFDIKLITENLIEFYSEIIHQKNQTE